MADKESFNLTKFDGTNFDMWKYSLSFVLDAQELTDFVEGVDQEPDKATKLADWKTWKKTGLMRRCFY